MGGASASKISNTASQACLGCLACAVARRILFCCQLLHPPLQHTVQGPRTDDHLLSNLPVSGVEQKRLCLPTPQPAVTANQLLESGNLVRLRVAEAVHQNIRSIGETIGAAQMRGGVGTEVSERVLPRHTVVSQIVPARRPNDYRSVRLGVDHHEAKRILLNYQMDGSSFKSRVLASSPRGCTYP